jgi:hypothetical protein
LQFKWVAQPTRVKKSSDWSLAICLYSALKGSFCKTHSHWWTFVDSISVRLWRKSLNVDTRCKFRKKHDLMCKIKNDLLCFTFCWNIQFLSDAVFELQNTPACTDPTAFRDYTF